MSFYLTQNNSEKSYHEKAADTIRTNYYGVLKVTDAFLPLLQLNSR